MLADPDSEKFTPLVSQLMKVFTFGLKQTYNGERRSETLKRFIWKENINYVIDIRKNRGNRYSNWDCNGKNVAQMIKSVFDGGCEYNYCGLLGIPGYQRRKFRYDHTAMEHWYLTYLYENRDFVRGYFTQFQGQKILLLCVENLKNPRTPHCHRIWLRDWLISEGLAELGNREEI